MGESSNSDEGRVSLGNYIDHSPFYLLFRDEEAMSILYAMQDDIDGMTPARVRRYIDVSEEDAESILEFLHTLELVLELPEDPYEEGPRYELNQCHELNRALEAPHMDRLIGDEVIAGVLDCYLGKTYLDCLSTDSLQHLTGFDEAAIEEANATLRKFRLVRSGMVLDGSKLDKPTAERAEHFISVLDDLAEAADDDIEFTRSQLESLVSHPSEAADDGSDDQYIIGRDELRDVVHTHASLGAPAIEVTNSIFTFEGGERGHTLNKRHDAARHLYDTRTSLLRHCEEIQDRYDARPTRS